MRQLARLAQGMHLGVRFAGTHVPTFADDLAVMHDDAADPGIGVGGIQALPRELQGPCHITLIVHCRAGSRDRRSISSRNSLRSWKRRYTEAKRI